MAEWSRIEIWSRNRMLFLKHKLILSRLKLMRRDLIIGIPNCVCDKNRLRLLCVSIYQFLGTSYAEGRGRV